MTNIATLTANVNKAQAAAEAAQNELLSNLHTLAGYSNTSELITALQSVNGVKPKGKKTVAAAPLKPGVMNTKTKKANGVGKKASTKKKPGRARIDHAAVVAALKEGDTAKAVAEKMGCSLPAVNLIKKKAGLTKSR